MAAIGTARHTDFSAIYNLTLFSVSRLQDSHQHIQELTRMLIENKMPPDIEKAESVMMAATAEIPAR